VNPRVIAGAINKVWLVDATVVCAAWAGTPTTLTDRAAAMTIGIRIFMSPFNAL
jgi:hypothetical protein